VNKIKYKGENNMSTTELTAQIESLRALEELIEEAKAEAEALRDAIKQEMLIRDTEELSAGQYIVRWTSVLSNRFDTTAFKKVMPEVFKAYTKQVSSRRFTISA
jgi:predicted phage-related endonuclease